MSNFVKVDLLKLLMINEVDSAIGIWRMTWRFNDLYTFPSEKKSLKSSKKP